MKVLFVDDSDTIRLLFIPVVENLLRPGVTLIEAVSAEQAISHLKDNSDIDHIICDYEMPGGNGDLVYKYVLENNLSIRFALHSTLRPEQAKGFESFPNKSKGEYYIQKPKGLIQFKHEMLEFLEHSGLNLTYAKLKKSTVLRFNRTLCDFYIRLGTKFIKIIKAGDMYTKEDIDKYLDNEKHFIYVKHEDLESFLEDASLRPYLINDPLVEVDKTVIKTAHAVLHESALRLGLSEESIMFAKSIAENIINKLDKSDPLSKLLLNMRRREDYIYEHSFLTSVLCCEMCKSSEWNDKTYMEKFCYAAIFHDITLNNPDYAAIHSKESEAFKELSTSKKAYIESHPVAASTLVNNSDAIPNDVDKIILFHHEGPAEDAFPRNISTNNIPPLARMFIVAHEFIHNVQSLDELDASSISSCLKRMENIYGDDKSFKKYFKLLKDVVAVEQLT